MAGAACSCKSAALALFLLLPLLGLYRTALAVDYTVGGASVGWNVQASNPNFYNIWATQQSFHAGDALVFVYNRTLYNVLRVSESAFQKCTLERPLNIWTDGNTKVVLPEPGQYYFIDGLGHCEAGVRIALTVAQPGPTAAPPARPPTIAPASRPSLPPSIPIFVPPTSTPIRAPTPAPTPKTAPAPTPKSAPAPTPKLAPAPTPNRAPAPAPLKHAPGPSPVQFDVPPPPNTPAPSDGASAAPSLPSLSVGSLLLTGAMAAFALSLSR